MVSARYWRITTKQAQIVQGSADIFSVAELQLRLAEGVAENHSAVTRFDTETWQNNTASWGPQFAFDNNAATYYSGGSATGDRVLNKSLGLDFGSARDEPAEIFMQMRVGSREQGIGGFDLEYSNDNLSYTSLRSWRNLNWGEGVTQLFKVKPWRLSAVGVRKIRAAYAGPCMRIRRSSDNAEQDFGFVNNTLDTAAILVFVGSGSGFVRTWYDQSGFSLHWQQATAAQQPIIVNAGVLQTQASGKPAPYWDGNRVMVLTGLSIMNASTPVTFMATCRTDQTAYKVLVNQKGSGNGNSVGYNGSRTLNLQRNGVADVAVGASGNAAAAHVVSWQLGGAWYFFPGAARLNGVAVAGNFTQGTGGYVDELYLGRTHTGGEGLVGYIGEVQIFNDISYPDITTQEQAAGYAFGVAGYNTPGVPEGSGGLIARRRPLFVMRG